MKQINNLSDEDKVRIIKEYDLLFKAGEFEKLMDLIIKYDLKHFLILKPDSIEIFKLTEKQCKELTSITIDDNEYYIKKQAEIYKVRNERSRKIRKEVKSKFLD